MRVGVFIDGQNITIGARYAFGHGNMHPLLLGRALAGERPSDTDGNGRSKTATSATLATTKMKSPKPA